MSPSLRRLALLGLLPFVAAGCKVAQGVADLPGSAVRAVSGSKDPATDPVDLQEMLLRLADSYQVTMTLALDNLRRPDGVLDAKLSLQLKIALASATHAMASGADPRSNLLDLTAFVTLTRMAVEEHWQPAVFGESGLPILASCRESEEQFWKLAAIILKPEQQEEYRKAVTTWYRTHPRPESVLAARSVGFAAELSAANKESSTKSESIGSFLSLDPLAGLDPAVREITQTRLFAERALYVAQRLPKLLRWQTELLTLEILESKAATQLVANTTQISGSVDRLTAVAEKLPDRLSKEREELVKAMESQEKTLKPMLQDVRQSVEAGHQMSQSLTVTLKTFDAVLKHVEEIQAKNPSSPNAEPFRIQDYTKAAAQLEATSKNFTDLLAALDRTLTSPGLDHLSKQVAPAVAQAEAAGRTLVDLIFMKALILIGAIFVAALAYRFISVRLAAR